MASMKFNNVYLNNSFTLIGPVEKKGPLGKGFDYALDDYYFGEKTHESCEVKMQYTALNSLLKKSKLKMNDIDLLVGGELSNQIAVTNYNMAKFNMPFLGIYSACASYVQSIIILGNMIEGSMIKKGIALTSAHNLVSEKQFRYPVEYGSLRPKCATFTATGAVASIISSDNSNIKLESATIGKVYDLGVKDANNMGAAMAPSAAHTLNKHMTELKRKPNYYDLILTGDLGRVGSKLFLEFLEKEYKIVLKNHMDSGCELYYENQKNINSGGSGPAVLPLVLNTKILRNSAYKKILVIGTGALMSQVMVNQKNSIPSISHAISLEVK